MKLKVSRVTIIEFVILVILLAIIYLTANYGLKLSAARSRDAKRITDLDYLQGRLFQSHELSNSYRLPVKTDAKSSAIDYNKSYKNLLSGDALGTPYTLGLSENPADYGYNSDGKTSYVIFVKMESDNYAARNDGGKHNTYPNDLYYEIGAGPNWVSLLP